MLRAILNKSIKKNLFEIRYIYLFIVYVAGSLISIIPLFAFFLILSKYKLLHLKKNALHYFYFSFCSFLVVLYGFLKKGSDLNEFWLAYYAPTEGGIALFLRWLYYSLLRVLGESNKLDLGASSFSIMISIFFLIMGLLYVFRIRQNVYILEFMFIVFLTNLILSVLKIFPFGGSRANTYYMILIIYIMTLGIKFLGQSTKIENLVVFGILIFIFSNFHMQKIDYFQTNLKILGLRS